MAKVLVLSADKFDFTDDRGKQTKGVSIHLVNEYREETPDSRGHKPSKISVSSQLELGVISATNQYPAVCDIDFGTKPGKDGKATAFVSAFRYLAHVPLEKIFGAVQATPAR